MAHTFNVGQRFSLDIPNVNTLGETWIVTSVSHPIIDFSIVIDWLVDAHYMNPQTTETFQAKIVRQHPKWTMLISASYPDSTTGMRIEGNTISFCDEHWFRWYMQIADAS